MEPNPKNQFKYILEEQLNDILPSFLKYGDDIEIYDETEFPVNTISKDISDTYSEKWMQEALANQIDLNNYQKVNEFLEHKLTANFMKKVLEPVETVVFTNIVFPEALRLANIGHWDTEVLENVVKNCEHTIVDYHLGNLTQEQVLNLVDTNNTTKLSVFKASLTDYVKEIAKQNLIYFDNKAMYTKAGIDLEQKLNTLTSENLTVLFKEAKKKAIPLKETGELEVQDFLSDYLPFNVITNLTKSLDKEVEDGVYLSVLEALKASDINLEKEVNEPIKVMTQYPTLAHLLFLDKITKREFLKALDNTGALLNQDLTLEAFKKQVVKALESALDIDVEDTCGEVMNEIDVYYRIYNEKFSNIPVEQFVLEETDLIHTKEYQSKENKERYRKLIEERYFAFLQEIIRKLDNATPDSSPEVRNYILAYSEGLKRRYNLPWADANWLMHHLVSVSTKNVPMRQIEHINDDVWWNFPYGTDRSVYEQLDEHLAMIYPKKWEQVLDYADWEFATEGAMNIDY